MTSLTVFSRTSLHVETVNVFPKIFNSVGRRPLGGATDSSDCSPPKYGQIARTGSISISARALISVARHDSNPAKSLFRWSDPPVSRLRFAGYSSFDISEL